MKRLILSLPLLLLSILSFGQAGSQSLSGVFFRVQDTVTYQAAAATKHANGYKDIYWNEQSTTPHWDVWNGSSYDHIFGFNSGGSGSSTSHNKLPPIYHVNDFTLVPGDTSRMLILEDNVSTVTLGDFSTGVDGSQFVLHNSQDAVVTIDPDGQQYLGSLTISDSTFSYIYFANDTFRISSSGSGGISSLDVGTTSVTSGTGGILYDNTGTLGELSSTGTGNVVRASSPTLTTPALGTPSAVVLTNGTGLPPTTGISGWPANSSGILTNDGAGNLSWGAAAGASWLLASGGTLTGANTITGTTTNILKAVFAGLGTTQTNGAGLWLANTDAAAAGAQQRSPGLVFEGQGWKTNATAASQSVKWIIDALPIQAAANPSVNLTYSNSINGGAYSQVATLSSGGIFTAGQFTTNSGNVTWLGGQTITTGGGTMSVNTLGGTNATLLSIIPQASITGTSGTQVAVNIGSSTGFGPTSGTAEYSLLRLNSAVNQTGGANGDVRVLDINTTYTAAGGNVIGIHYRPTVTSISGTHTALKLGSGSVSVDNGNLTLATTGNKLLIKEGSNAALGQATLVGGTVTVNNTIVTANSKIFLTVETAGGTQGLLSYTKSPSTSFTINSTSGTETSTVSWFIVEPAP